MDGQAGSILHNIGAGVNTPQATGTWVLFIDADDADKLKVKLTDGTILTAKVGGVAVQFSA